MKIAIIGSANFDSLEFHLNDELKFQGHDSKIFDFNRVVPKKINYGLRQYSSKYDIAINNSVLKKILRFQPDLVIGVKRDIHPFLVKAIKGERIKIIHINPDSLTTIGSQQIFAEEYDAYFTKDPFIHSFMKNKLLLNVFQYQEAFNPRVHKSYDGDLLSLQEKINIDVVSFGTLYPYRNKMLRSLKDEKIDIITYGRKAKYFDATLEDNFQNKGIYGKEKANILCGSRIVFNNFHYAEIDSVNNKFFEINGLGAFQICDYKPILNQLLPVNPKLVSFGHIDEASRLIKYYLKRDKERLEISDAIKSHFHENYTYKNLISHVFSRI